MSLSHRTYVFGDYWEPKGQLSELGLLISKAKDRRDPVAVTMLTRLLSTWFTELELPSDPVIVAVPPSPNRVDALAPKLAAAMATVLQRPLELHWLVRAAVTGPVRDTPEHLRAGLAALAGYRAEPAVRGHDLVLVDDVILTGATTGHLARLALQAGASSVTVVVVARTRRVLM